MIFNSSLKSSPLFGFGYNLTSQPLETVNMGTRNNDLVSLWSFCDGKLKLASRTMTFLCQNDYGPCSISKADLNFLCENFEDDEGYRYSWGLDSEFVKPNAVRLHIQAKSLGAFLESRQFDPNRMSKPGRARRDDWIENRWKVDDDLALDASDQTQRKRR